MPKYEVIADEDAVSFGRRLTFGVNFHGYSVVPGTFTVTDLGETKEYTILVERAIENPCIACGIESTWRAVGTENGFRRDFDFCDAHKAEPGEMRSRLEGARWFPHVKPPSAKNPVTPAVNAHGNASATR